MSNEEENENKPFKFVDKRRFNMDGDLREGAALEDSTAATETTAPKQDETPPAAAPAASELPSQASERETSSDTPPSDIGDEGEMPFLLFIQSLAQQAFMHMGLIPHPDGSQQMVLEAARQTIDIISMLQKKTAGNITEEEAELLQKVLYELRMVYLEIVNNAGKAPADPNQAS